MRESYMLFCHPLYTNILSFPQIPHKRAPVTNSKFPKQPLRLANNLVQSPNPPEISALYEFCSIEIKVRILKKVPG